MREDLSTGCQEHAILWTGSAYSRVDLNPSGYTSSRANAVNGGQAYLPPYAAIG